MTTGDDPAPPDAEHYLDLSDVRDEQTGPHFDVVLRGYDRRQVDDHVAALRRMVAQLTAQLAVRQRRSASSASASSASVSSSASPSPSPSPSAPPSPSPSSSTADAIPEARPSDEVAVSRADAATTRLEGTEPGDGADTVGAFNDRLRGILAAAEQEAQVVRSRAAESLLAEHAESRAALADLRAQRDAVFDDLVRLRGWLDELVTTAGRPGSAPPAPSSPMPARPGPWRPRGPVPGSAYPPGPHRGQPRPHGSRPGGPDGPGAVAPRPPAGAAHDGATTTAEVDGTTTEVELDAGDTVDSEIPSGGRAGS